MRNIALLRSSFWLSTMKYTVLQLIMAVLFSFIGYAEPGRSQGVLDREVTLNMKEKKLEYVLTKIEEQTKVMFVFSPKLIQSNRLVTISKSKEKLSVVLDDLSKQMNIEYEVAGDKVILKRQLTEKAGEETAASTEFAFVPITGKITNARGEPLSGV